MEPKQPASQAETEDEPGGPWIEYRVEHRHRETNELISHRDTKGPGPDHDGNIENRSRAAFILVTTYKTRTTLSPTSELSPPSYSLHLISPAIVNALRSVVQYYPSQDLTGDIVINWPYAILVHHYDELTQFRDNVGRKDKKDLCEREMGAYDDLSLLLQYLDTTIMPEVRTEIERNAKGYYTFEYAWVRWKPGTTILTTISGQVTGSTEPHPRAISSMKGGTFEQPSRDWIVEGWQMIFDGQYLGRKTKCTLISKFDGETEDKDEFFFVRDLDHTNELPESVSNQLKYGQIYWRLLHKQCRQYKGKTQGDFPQEVDGLVMVDIQSYIDQVEKPDLMGNTDCRNWTSDCKCEVCKIKSTNDKNSRKMASLFEDYNSIALESETLTPHQYLLCQFEIPAFIFKTRTWESLHVRDFSEPKFDEGLVNHLVMEPQRKRTLMALAKCFARTNRNGETLKGEPWTADFIQGKGHGLIFLLHGRPGVGKTYTAECIAAFTKRPLMVLTASDIGTDPEDVEANLTAHFKIARRWGAVLLIDEADVFMERRSTADLVRNSLVAGFLRALEFYDGILFLTTNRVGSFDDAFISRVHIQLYYPEFDDDQRRQIWQTFIDKLAKERGDYMRLNIDAKDYIRGNEMRGLKWNGREIRNAFQTAVSLAEYDAEKGEDGKVIITDEHLRAVVELSRDFKTYLNDLHKGDEAKRAERKYERLDSYGGS